MHDHKLSFTVLCMRMSTYNHIRSLNTGDVLLHETAKHHLETSPSSPSERGRTRLNSAADGDL